MPLVGDTTATTTTTTTMTTTATTTTTTTTTLDIELDRSDFLVSPIQDQSPNNQKDNMTNSSAPSIDYEFDEAQCLFCNQTSPDMDQNLVHMSKAHGLHVDPENLVVDVSSLLAYFHLVISGQYECLYCGTQRNTRQAVQQHMMAKSHCKYDITDKNSDLKDFYEPSDSDETEDLHPARRFHSDDPRLPSYAKSRKPRPSRRADRHASDLSVSPPNQAAVTSAAVVPTRTPESDADAESSSRSLLELSARALKQEHLLNSQLSQLRADDRRSLLHLPAAQQRALLATHFKQIEQARKMEQTQRTNLGSAGNRFNCLGKIRLIRKPPHTGNIHSLKR